MTTFEIGKKDFLLDGKPFKILSGAIHYFRVDPSDWYHSLFNLKALGFNTVETYVPWNEHEKKEGVFNFEGRLDVERFIQMAQDLGLYVILRPSPYICAEWEFGGFPAWMLTKSCRLRSNDSTYLDYVKRYFDVLLPRLTKYQVTQGGKVIMMQLENEYGSYGEDKDYLRKLYDLMREGGVEVPIFTSDGAWQQTLEAGTLLDEDKKILVTGNFGSKGKENFHNLQTFMDEHNLEMPLMCAEFWDGWFGQWGKNVVTREADELVESLREVLELGSVNLYMFHGGTNFGWMNSTSGYEDKEVYQVTSYDYFAPLDEQGNPTERYYAIQDLIHELYPEIEQAKPLIKESVHPQSINKAFQMSLFEALDQFPSTQTLYPETFEDLGYDYGYVLYQSKFHAAGEEEKLRLVRTADRAHVFIDEEHLITQDQMTLGKGFTAPVRPQEWMSLAVLVENRGRVDYGFRLLSDSQRKGIRGGVMADLHFLQDWTETAVDLDKVDNLQFKSNEPIKEKTPAFYAYDFDWQEERKDAYLDMTGFGKGVVWVNGHNLGRFDAIGPWQSLYCPAAFFEEGQNRIVVFETEGQAQDVLSLTDHAVFKEVEKED